MPFNTPYRDKFESGDLVYGLSKPREEWLKKRADEGALIGKNWIDKYNVDLTKVSDAVNVDFIVQTLQHPKYHKVMKTTTHPQATESKQHAWRSKSKAGLNWAVTTHKHVHFILDNLDMSDVAKKTNTKGNPDYPQGKAPSTFPPKDKVRTITNAELRWVYRHKDHPDVQKHIQFWLDDKPCCPPWYSQWVGKQQMTGDQLWADYQPTHTYSKHLSTPD
jgi:hypothetical protein